MSAGYRPFRDIFAAQGPLLLDLLHPWFVLFGQDLVAARWSVGVYSLVGLAGAYWLARLVGGPLAALTAATLLVLSPLYLEGSRIALAEVPALAPATFAVGAAIMYARSGSRRWLVACGVLLAVSLLIKPITLAAGVPAGLAVLSRWRRGLRAHGGRWAAARSAGRSAWHRRGGRRRPGRRASTRSWRTGWRVAAAKAGASGRTAWRSLGRSRLRRRRSRGWGRGRRLAALAAYGGRGTGGRLGRGERGVAAGLLAAAREARRRDDPAACGPGRGRRRAGGRAAPRHRAGGCRCGSYGRRSPLGLRFWSGGTRRPRRHSRSKAANCSR